jgi:hypothetical protein
MGHRFHSWPPVSTRLTATPAPTHYHRWSYAYPARGLDHFKFVLDSIERISDCQTDNLLLPVIKEDWDQPRNERWDAHDENHPKGRRWAVAHLGNEEEAALLGFHGKVGLIESND